MIFTLQLSADPWRVVLKGEQPDYIHAANINVGFWQLLACMMRLLIIVNE